MTAFDMTESIAPKSDQLNAEDLLTGPRTVTIAEVKRGTAEQPVDVHLVEFPGRPFKPSKTVRRIMVAAWGPDASAYAGKRMTLYRDPAVRFGGMDVGGIRVSHMSGIDKPMTLVLAVSKGKRAPYVIKPLADDAPPAAPVPNYMADARAAKDMDEWRKVWMRAKDAGHLTDALRAELTPIGEALKAEQEQPEQPADTLARNGNHPGQRVVSAARAKGTRHESAIVAFLREHGFPWADRMPLSGTKDRGDVTIGPGSPVIEAKNVKQAEWAKALDEANAEAHNAKAPFGVVWAKRNGKGCVGDGFVVMDGHTFVELLHEAGYAWEPPLPGRGAA